MTISRSQMNKQLKSAPAGNKGLKKLSPEVRNQIGFMSKGGTVMKSKGGAVKMSKGGAVKMIWKLRQRSGMVVTATANP